MIQVYINYPVPHFTIHRDSNCGNIQQHHKKDQRIISMDHSNLSRELLKFRSKGYRFAAQPELNDMWLSINLEDFDFEKSVISHIRHLLGKSYSPFRGAKIDEHCQD